MLNGRLKYKLDTSVTITLPNGFTVNTVEISGIARSDTTAKIADTGKGNIITMIPCQYLKPGIYNYVVTDWYLKRSWLFGRRRLYAVRKGVILKDYYLKRIKVKSKGT